MSFLLYEVSQAHLWAFTQVVTIRQYDFDLPGVCFSHSFNNPERALLLANEITVTTYCFYVAFLL
jgi:hypothetical protein